MEQATNQLDTILQLSHPDSNQVCYFQSQNFTLFNNSAYPLNIEQRQLQKNQFFGLSPKPFHKSTMINHQFYHHNFNRNQLNHSQQFYINTRLNLQDQQCLFKWFGSDKQSQIYNQQSSFLGKKNDSSQFCFKFEKIETQKKQEIQIKNQYLLKQNQRQIKQQDEQIFQNEAKNEAIIQNDALEDSAMENQARLPKHQKGLKYLSNAVYQILKNKQKTTFNNVAKLLVQGLKKKAAQQHKQFDDRQQKNIKRRAYDALNVMIASQIIQKQDKFIYLKNEINGNKSRKSKLKAQQKLMNDINQSLFRIQMKKNQIQTLQQRKKNMQAFMQQKKLNSNNNDRRIYFPFLYLKTNEQNFISYSQVSRHKQFHCQEKQNSITCDQYPEQNCVQLKFRYNKFLGESLQLFGDADIMVQLGRQIRKQQSSLPSTEIQSLSLT